MKVEAGLTITHDIPIHIFAYLEERWPFCVILKVKCKLICLGEGVKVAFCESINVFRTESSKSSHLRIRLKILGCAGDRDYDIFEAHVGQRSSDLNTPASPIQCLDKVQVG